MQDQQRRALMITLDGWGSALTRYCQHGDPEGTCTGARGYAPCAQDEYTYCQHGGDIRATTKEGAPRCPWCRGVTRKQRNRDTWQPPRLGNSSVR